MPSVQYRLFFNNTPATREQLDRFDDITVSQEMDMAWQANLQIPFCTDDKGQWKSETKNFIADFRRIRIEIKVGDAPFVALIDGPIVGSNRQMNSEPGRSMLTLTVQDDSVYLNREETVFRFEKLRDDEIATQVFQRFQQVIKQTRIDTTPSPPNPPNPLIVQRRETAMQLLRFLAERQGLHAYVLPGQRPSQSIGCFKALPTELDGLPPLILLGSDRNMFAFNPTNDAQRPARFRAYALRVTDKAILRSESNLESIPRLGQKPTLPESDTAVQILPPRHGDAVDLDKWVTGETLRASYAVSATGSVLGDCYAGVLSPYRLITVRGVDKQYNGNYLITRVTHNLTRSLYSQDFTLRRNAQSTAASPNNNSGLPQASANLSVSFNVQGRIF